MGASAAATFAHIQFEWKFQSSLPSSFRWIACTVHHLTLNRHYQWTISNTVGRLLFSLSIYLVSNKLTIFIGILEKWIKASQLKNGTRMWWFFSACYYDAANQWNPQQFVRANANKYRKPTKYTALAPIRRMCVCVLVVLLAFHCRWNRKCFSFAAKHQRYPLSWLCQSEYLFDIPLCAVLRWK